MLIKAPTLAYLFILATQTGDVTTDGKPEQRTTVKREHARGHATLIPKLREKIEVAVLKEGEDIADYKDDGEVPMEKVEWVKIAEQNNRKELNHRFIDSEFSLSDKELNFLKWCLEKRDEPPTASIETLDQLAALGIEV